MLADLLRFNREASASRRTAAPSPARWASSSTRAATAGRCGTLPHPDGGLHLVDPRDPDPPLSLATFLHFCANHGLLAVSNRPQWRTVKGGAREYVRKLVAALPDVRLSTPVHQVRRHADRVDLSTDHGTQSFDQVVLATHTDQSLALSSCPR